MTYTDAKHTIINSIRNRVYMFNMYVKEDDSDPEIVQSLRNEITGMLICLKNISLPDETWCTKYIEGRIEFGYFDEFGIWISVQK